MVSKRWLSWMTILVAVGCGNDGDTDATQDRGDAGAAGLGGSGGAGGSAGTAGSSGSAGTAGFAGSGGTAGMAGAAGAAGASGEAGHGGSLPPPPCPTFDDGIENGTVASDDIDEASGMVWSRRNTDVLWVHNDSGDSARVFALDVTGTYLGEFSLPGQNARDWEDMTLGPGPESGAEYLYLGDIGDNSEVRADIVVFRAKEPLLDLSSTPVVGTLDDFVGLRFTYPGGANNAETLLSDPATGDLYIVTKKSSGNSGVYRAAAPHDASATTELESVATLHFGQAPLSGDPLATAGDVTADGSWIAIRSYGRAYAWYRTPGTPLWEAFDDDPCPLPLRSEPQGETFAWSPEGERYVTVSENSSQPIYMFSLVP